jgi:hypothetical protein
MNKKVACYSHAHAKDHLKLLPVVEALRWMEHNPPSARLVREIRDLTLKVWQASNNPDQYRKLKDRLNALKEWKLLCVMLAGHSQNGERTDDALVDYTGVMLHDQDKIWDEKELKEIIKILASDEYPFACCIKRSISKVGLHIITFTTATREQHEATWDRVAEVIEFKTGHQVDRSTRTLSRLCFNSPGPFVWRLSKPRFPGVTPEPKRLEAPVELPKDWPHNLTPLIEQIISVFGSSIKGEWRTYKETKYTIPFECLIGGKHSKRNHAVAIANEDGSVRLTCFNEECRESVTFEQANKKLWQLIQDLAKALPQYTIRSAQDILALELDEHDNLLEDRLLTKGGMLCLVGQGGIGKSRLAIHLAVALVLNKPWLGLPTWEQRTPLRILFLQSQNSNRRLKDEIGRMRKVYGDEFLTRVFFQCLDKGTDGFVKADANRERLEQAVADCEPNIVIFDPLSSFGIGDLNTDADMILTCNTLEQIVRKDDITRALIPIHHSLTGRGGFKIKYDRASFARNSKALHGYTRAQINVLPGTPKYDKLVIDCGKNNDGEEFDMFAVKRVGENLIYELDHHFDFEEWERETQSGKAGKKKESVLDKLAELEGFEDFNQNQVIKLIQKTYTEVKGGSLYEWFNKGRGAGIFIHNGHGKYRKDAPAF